MERRDSESSGAYLAWEHLTVLLPRRPAKRLLTNINGYASPGRVLALMGPSGSGKSLLLDSLAGRLASDLSMEGTVLLNGSKRGRRHGDGVVAYVTQENTLLGTMTVRETIDYSARLRFPSGMAKKEVKDAVERTIEQMGLTECAEKCIGNWHLRGISGGERKRLCIALEILTQPPILFLDEPTTGLDTASAYIVAMTMRMMATEWKTTIVTSIHQPNGDVFSLFDDLCLLSTGQLVYFGDATKAKELFQLAGFPCPARSNPSDHFLRCINTDFDKVHKKIRGSKRFADHSRHNTSCDPLTYIETSDIKERLIDYYNKSEDAIATGNKILQIFKTEWVEDGLSKSGEVDWWRQLKTLTNRSFTNMWRDFGYYWIRIIVYIIVSLCVGSLFFSLGTDYNDIQARAACVGFIFAFMSMMSIGGLPSFIEEMKVFTLERVSGYYGVVVFVLSNFFASVPFLSSISLCSSMIIYNMVGLYPGLPHLLFFALNLFGSLAIIESIMMIVASFVPNFLMGIGVGAGLLGIMILSGGYLRLLSDLPKAIWRYPISYMSFVSWALQGQYKNDMLGLEFGSITPGGLTMSGDQVIQRVYGFSLDHSKWFDLSMIYILLVSYKFTFLLILKSKERRVHSRFFSSIRHFFSKG